LETPIVQSAPPSAEATVQNDRLILAPRGNADGLLTFAGRSISFYEEHPQAPRQQRWQFTVQRELAQRVLFEASYVGNYGSSIQVSKNYLPLPLQYLSTSPLRDPTTINYLSAQVTNPFYPLLPGTGLAGTTVSRSYLLSSGVYPQFTGMTGNTYDGYSIYHSLQVKMERRFSRGWTLNGVYQWSKNLQAISRLNGQPSALEKVISDQDRPHRGATFSALSPSGLSHNDCRRWAFTKRSAVRILFAEPNTLESSV
jgi:hypothetical protein